MMTKNQKYYVVFARENDKSWMTKVATLTFEEFLNVCEKKKETFSNWMNTGLCKLYLKLGDKEFAKLINTKCILFICPTQATYNQLKDDDFTFINNYTGFDKPYVTDTITSGTIDLMRLTQKILNKLETANL